MAQHPRARAAVRPSTTPTRSTPKRATAPKRPATAKPKPKPKPTVTTARPAAKRHRHGGLSKTGKTVSRAQQRYLFHRFGERARQWTTRGRYRHLPERKRPPTARTAR